MITRPRSLNRTLGLQQAVGADDDVDACRRRARRWSSLASRSLWNRDSGRTTTGKLANRSLNVVEVLLHQQRRRHQHGHLLAVLDRLERGAHGDLGLAVADVAADQPVHRDVALHVGLDLVDAASWSGVSTYGNASSSSRCHGVSGPNA